MKSTLVTIVLVFFSIVAVLSISTQAKEKEPIMNASGSFEVKLEPQKDESAPAGRMLIRKQYTGDIEGIGTGQMISKRTPGGVAVYSAIEEFEGSVGGKKGAFTFIHNGFMSGETQSLEVKILQGSGQGELENISGLLEIIQEGSAHKYNLSYKLE